MGKNAKISLPAKVARILNTLGEHGYEAYAVGGCVRDSLLGRTPQDWDITTSARPEQVKALFTRTLDTGIQHGTVTIMVGKEGYVMVCCEDSDTVFENIKKALAA